ncbi:polysaccharide lyase 8 family protein [Sphaerimonospora cavernae]|uniref:Polysaccharide lyase 8 family protein n=1 Tax=Sphaerimonospora cavernae TaxID=1740611 RepID=A0ABV6U6R2_9ACTN
MNRLNGRTLHSRRLFLQLGGVAAAGVLIPVACAVRASCAGHVGETVDRAWDGSFTDAFALLRRNWRDVMAGSGFDAAAEPYRKRLAALGRTAARHRDAMAPTVTSLWPDLAFPSFIRIPARLLAMARAYVLPGTGVTGDASLGAAVAAGIDHYRRHVYVAGADPVGNWWDWEIGVPKRLLDAAVLIGSHLTDEQGGALAKAVDHFVPECRLDDYSGTSTGANRVDLCTVTLLRAALGSDPGRAALAVAALAPVFSYVDEGDGFHRDGSFLQHTRVPYQGGYGAVLLTGVATLLAVLRGSPWEIDNRSRQFVFDLVEKSFAPFVHDGFCMDVVRGRGIGREPYGDHRRGREIAAAILLLSEAAPARERIRWQGMVKGWAVPDSGRPMLKAALNSDLGFHARLASIMTDDAIPAAGEPTGHRLFPSSARAVHRGPDWCAALSMASSRVAHYEYGNGENLRGWHTGSGMLCWWAGDGHGDQYSDGYWQTVDPYRLPGTTVSTRRLPDGAGEEWGETCPPARWVGGATDGTYAMIGQHLHGFESSLEAFKSWLFLDDAVVCLGAGITCADGVPVETVVDNRRTDATLIVHEAAGWAHLEGHGGYVLPAQAGGGRMHRLREERKGDSTTRSYVTLWLDHGVDPASAGYVYLLLPGASPARTCARASDAGWVRVLANTARRQAIQVPSLGITAVNFWNAGTVGGLTADGPCAVLVREIGDGTATLTVSDPRCDLSGLTVTWDRPVAGVHPSPVDDLVSVTTGDRLTLTFGRLADLAGSSTTVTVRMS